MKCLRQARSWDRPFRMPRDHNTKMKAFKPMMDTIIHQRDRSTSCNVVKALLSSCDMPALGTCPSKFLGHARSWDMPFKILGTGPLLGHALLNVWDRPALGTCPLKCLGQARSWDMPFRGAIDGYAEYHAKRYLELLALPST